MATKLSDYKMSYSMDMYMQQNLSVVDLETIKSKIYRDLANRISAELFKDGVFKSEESIDYLSMATNFTLRIDKQKLTDLMRNDGYYLDRNSSMYTSTLPPAVNTKISVTTTSEDEAQLDDEDCEEENLTLKRLKEKLDQHLMREGN